jgi:UDP-N-acetylglucosamine 1-carboxyvinyltransferase
MDAFRITGGSPLKGEVTVAGAKNQASKMLIACLLTDEPVVLRNMPRQQETDITQEIIASVGAEVAWEDRHTARVRVPEISSSTVPELTRKNRISILTLAPLLHRTGEAFVPALGGDKIGPRPVNFHIDLLEQMGARIEATDGGYKATVDGRLKGTRIELPYPSVGATESALLAGVLAEGRTKILNCALEPEIHGLIMMLQKMGAIIELGAGRSIEVIGVEKLRGCEATVIPDRLEAASYACMAIGTKGDILVKGARHDHMMTFLNMVRRIGAEYEVTEEGIRFYTPDGLRGIELETDTYPGFSTDWQQPFVVTLTQAAGTSVVHETVYEDRFGYTKQLNEMGADITLFPSCLGEIACRFNGKNCLHSAVVKGPTPLHATDAEVLDIRAGLALVIAAMVAEGTSTLTGIHHLDRGYEDLEEKLKGIGAQIERVAV